MHWKLDIGHEESFHKALDLDRQARQPRELHLAIDCSQSNSCLVCCHERHDAELGGGTRNTEHEENYLTYRRRGGRNCTVCMLTSSSSFCYS